MPQPIKQWLEDNDLINVAFYTYLILVFLATLMPTDNLETSSWMIRVPYFDKYVHIGMFFVFTILLYLKQKKRLTFFLISIALFVGMLIEVLQHVLPTGRSFDWLDFGADAVGVLVAVLGIKILNVKS